MTEVAIGNQSREKIVIRALGAPDSSWINAEAEISVGGFTGHVYGNLTPYDFPVFREQMAALYTSLSGDAIFSTVEDWIYLKISGDGKGHLHIKGRLLDDLGIGNELSFHLELDQSFIPNILQCIDAVIQEFPVLK